MNMHDNDIDKLFSAKLESFEVEPSAKVWAGIIAELDNRPKRKSIIPMLRIAAGVAVIISAGLFFLPKGKPTEQPVKGPKLVMNPAVKPTPVQQVQPQVMQSAPQIASAAQVQQVASVKHVKQTVPSVNHPEKQALVNSTTSQTITADPVKPDVMVNDQIQTMAANQTSPATVKPTMPDNATAIIDHSTDATPAFNTKPASTTAIAAVADDNKPVKKRRFSLGKVLNAVVGAVDKRQDKLIEFADTEEGETITGINIGVLKVKKVE